jgi:hypothetical protein
MNRCHASDNYGCGQVSSLTGIARRKLRMDQELVRFRKRKTAGHWHRENVQRAVASGDADFTRWFWLIDYRDNNRRLLKRAFTRLEAWRRNKTLKGSGRAWALVSD